MQFSSGLDFAAAPAYAYTNSYDYVCDYPIA